MCSPRRKYDNYELPDILWTLHNILRKSNVTYQMDNSRHTEKRPHCDYVSRAMVGLVAYVTKMHT